MTIMNSSTGKNSCLVDSERATISFARWFVCSTSSVPFRMLDNPYFVNMLKEQVPVRFRSTKNPKLTRSGMKKFIDAECELMKEEIKKVITEKLEDSKGIPFGQHIHDGLKSAK